MKNPTNDVDRVMNLILKPDDANRATELVKGDVSIELVDWIAKNSNIAKQVLRIREAVEKNGLNLSDDQVLAAGLPGKNLLLYLSDLEMLTVLSKMDVERINVISALVYMSIGVALDVRSYKATYNDPRRSEAALFKSAQEIPQEYTEPLSADEVRDLEILGTEQIKKFKSKWGEDITEFDGGAYGNQLRSLVRMIKDRSFTALQHVPPLRIQKMLRLGYGQFNHLTAVQIASTVEMSDEAFKAFIDDANEAGWVRNGSNILTKLFF